MEAGRPQLIWDGQCEFCRRAVAFVHRRDRRAALRTVSSQELGMGRLRAVLVETPDGRRLEGGRACLFVLGELGHPRIARLLGQRPLIWGVEAGYRLVSRLRGRL